MKRIIICIPPSQDNLLHVVVRALQMHDVKIFQSIDDGFDYLWREGAAVGLFILQLGPDHINELWTTAANWPKLHFLALHEEGDEFPETPPNISLIGRSKSFDFLEQQIQDYFHVRMLG